MIDFGIEKIAPLCEDFGLIITPEIKERLNIYGNMLLSFNEKVNLTAITEPTEVLYKHFYDCLLFFKNVNVKENASVIDVGTGAGFPGLVLKIARDDVDLTLLDALNKRLSFLNTVADNLGIKINTLHSRAEDGSRDIKYREKFDIATARAVAALPVLCEFCIPFVKPGGLFVAMKGDAAETEINASQNAFKVLGAEKPTVFYETLTGNEKRAFIISKKISQTLPKYPRSFAKIKKNAL